MGAKQSKRSVDISGKEAEGASEVAAAGAGGEGRVEQLADTDALKPQLADGELKPQLNGDAHIHEPSEKEKQLDNGTPENEKDATTEKEAKEQEPLANGDSEPKTENGDTPADDAKKPKKEKVKKKWSLRSISFSRKDKPKQEKKKDDDAKTNGEPEKVPEEAAETPDSEKKEVVEEKAETEVKEEKTPETPVTEPLTNGSSTPETPKEETLAVDDTPAVKENERSETPKAEPEPVPVPGPVGIAEPEQAPVNGLSEEETKEEVPAVVESETSKPEEPTVEKTEPVPATEIPVINEVCVEKMPLIEPTPPPLPANPPPSSVVSFAATTMAPELTDASLANTADVTSNTTHVHNIETNTEKIATEAISPDVQTNSTPVVECTENCSETSESKKIEEVVEENLASVPSNEIQNDEIKEVSNDVPQENGLETEATAPNEVPLSETIDEMTNGIDDSKIEKQNVEDHIEPEVKQNYISLSNDIEISNNVIDQDLTDKPDVESVIIDDKIKSTDETEQTTIKTASIENNGVNENSDDDISKQNINANSTENETGDKIMMNGDSKSEEKMDEDMPPSLSESAGGDCSNASESFPLPPSDLELWPPAPDHTQEITTSDKMADLIPEVPTIPELKTEIETTTDVAVTN